ncbi:MAG: efflux RND transporter periplasmic adaptor subunit [Bacteroidales bacterium]|nr:efflux RND transporter periplasmic adaptor subunit [Bacteroidales bacterium]
MKKRIILFGLAILVVILVVFILAGKKKTVQPVISYETAVVKRGDIQNTVTATGTLSAIITVNVGTQVSGVIKRLHADFNSRVKKGQLLAEMDKTPLLATLSETEAALENAKAQLLFQEANYNRIKPLYDKNLVAQTDYDQALYNYNMAKANVKSAESQYERARINLSYATIYSPIDGVVLNRAVSEGQTVAAGFNTPTLFTIANDLTQMQVEANVDEADIGQVKDGDRVTFTVDAFPDLQFSGKVTEVRLQPVTTNNVVTYTVVIKAPNPDLKLMPGMTASITIITGEAHNALLVPAKALQFTPSALPKNNVASPGAQGAGESFDTQAMKIPASTKTGVHSPAGISADSSGSKPPRMVWLKEGQKIEPRPVQTGIDDDIHVEILNGLREGDTVIIAENSGIKRFSVSNNQARSPFMPTPPRRR